jgi:1,4-alpha-glucan branching enzyme
MLTFLRKSRHQKEIIAVVFNFTPVPRYNYRVGVPRPGHWREILNSDSESYGGEDFGNLGGVSADEIPMHGRPYSINVIVPPLGAVFLKSETKELKLR